MRNLWANPSGLWVTEALYENENCEMKSGILNKVTWNPLKHLAPDTRKCKEAAMHAVVTAWVRLIFHAVVRKRVYVEH